jgi:hypothetical protein
MEKGRFKDYDEDGLRALAKELVDASRRKLARRPKGK